MGSRYGKFKQQLLEFVKKENQGFQNSEHIPQVPKLEIGTFSLLLSHFRKREQNRRIGFLAVCLLFLFLILERERERIKRKKTQQRNSLLKAISKRNAAMRHWVIKRSFWVPQICCGTHWIVLCWVTKITSQICCGGFGY